LQRTEGGRKGVFQGNLKLSGDGRKGLYKSVSRRGGTIEGQRLGLGGIGGGEGQSTIIHHAIGARPEEQNKGRGTTYVFVGWGGGGCEMLGAVCGRKGKGKDEGGGRKKNGINTTRF